MRSTVRALYRTGLGVLLMLRIFPTAAALCVLVAIVYAVAVAAAALEAGGLL